MWLKTTSPTGGKLIGLDRRSGWPAGHQDDKHMYMGADGRVNFGVFNGAPQIVSSGAPLNDGRWHHVVATQGPGGMQLYVDGALQASNPGVTTSADYSGYWAVGGSEAQGLSRWPNPPSTLFFNGQIDETAVYPSVLSPAQVAQHHALGVQAAP
jgi:hypothetical protein